MIWMHKIERGMRDFFEFIKQMELKDLPMTGRNFTWTNFQDKATLSRLDRFLLSHDCFDHFKVFQRGLPRLVPDHCPVMISDESKAI